MKLPPGVLQGRKSGRHDDVFCGATTTNGDTCRNWAGFKTEHTGLGPCYRHDRGRRYMHQLLLDFIESERLMGAYGDPIEVDPHTALLMEVHRTAGHVAWLRQVIDDMADTRKNGTELDSLVQYTPLGIQPSVWMQMYQDERKHLVRVCETCIKAGVAERSIQIAQDQARMLAMVIKSFILDGRMSFTPEQRIMAPTVIREIINTTSMQADTFAPLPELVESTATEPKPKASAKAKGKK